MALLNLVLYPDDPLTQTAEPVEDFGPELAAFARDMFESMVAYEGCGLAAPQVGVAKRLFVLDDGEGHRMSLVNPEILDWDGSDVGEEGCLSLPDIYAPVERATRLRVRAFDPLGKKLEFDARDRLARIIQHESDHLEGVCFVDRLDILTRQDKLEEWATIRSRMSKALAGERR